MLAPLPSPWQTGDVCLLMLAAGMSADPRLRPLYLEVHSAMLALAWALAMDDAVLHATLRLVSTGSGAALQAQAHHGSMACSGCVCVQCHSAEYYRTA